MKTITKAKYLDIDIHSSFIDQQQLWHIDIQKC